MKEDFGRLLWGTVVHRPYVYAFFVCFLVFALKQFGSRRALLYALSAYAIAFVCEFSSTRTGFPFGVYAYIDVTRTRELWISNVPFWDSLSFVFLSYFSWVVAGGVLSENLGEGLADWRAPWLGGFLMMLLDLVIDPVALQGDKWFLGRIYSYPREGSYFGVTIANFAGWLFVGVFTLIIAQRLMARRPPLEPFARATSPFFARAAAGVYAGVFLFNFVMMLIIHEWRMAWASAGVIAATLTCVFWALSRRHDPGVLNRRARP